MIGSVLLTTTGRILISDVNQRLVVNQTFPHMEELPLKSGVYQTARMAVINGVAYIGGRNGIIYLLTLPMDYLAGDSAAGTRQVIVKNVTLPLSGITEAFAFTADGVIAACFNNETNTLYVVNVHSPSDKSELQFTPHTDLSNVVPVENAFYFVQHGHLLRADVARGETQVKTLKECGQAWITTNEHYNIIIECENKSFVYATQEWSDAHGIKYGAYKNRDVQLKPCHGTSFVFSADDTMLTIYDSRNDFKKSITLPGNPDTAKLICTWNNGNLTLMNRDITCNCWKQHLLTERYEIGTSRYIRYSEGTLPLLPVDNISQDVLLFTPTYFLLPARHQLFFDLDNNVVHPMVTDAIVVFHAGIYPIRNSDNSIVKPIGPSDDPAHNSTGKQWPVYVLVGVGLVLVVIIVAGAYKQKPRILRFWNNIFRW